MLLPSMGNEGEHWLTHHALCDEHEERPGSERREEADSPAENAGPPPPGGLRFRTPLPIGTLSELFDQEHNDAGTSQAPGHSPATSIQAPNLPSRAHWANRWIRKRKLGRQ